MLPKFREELTGLLPEEMPYPYFAGREDAWLLHQRLSRPTRIAELRRGPLSKLLDRRSVRPVIAACGDGLLSADRLLPLADPLRTFDPETGIEPDKPTEVAFGRLCASDILPYTVSFTGWPDGLDDCSWRDVQISRNGGNLVVQVNFPDSYLDRFYRHFSEGARRCLEYWAHPVRREGPITMAWARLDADPSSDEVLIEELQTDWLRALRGHARRLVQDIPKPERPAAKAFLVDTVLRYGKHWAEATLLAAIAVTRSRLGARHVWLHQPRTGMKLKNIRGNAPPRSLYADLPRRFCFRPTDRAPEIIYRARPQAVHRLRRSGRPVFWHLDLDAPAV